MVANAIALYLEENGIRQSFICERTELTELCVSLALSGQRKLSIEEYAEICAALDLPYQFFFERRKKIA